MFSCLYCTFRTAEWRKLSRHTFECHSSVPGLSFKCGLGGCLRTFSRYSALQSHIARNHSKHDIPDVSLFGCHSVEQPSASPADETFSTNDFPSTDNAMIESGMEDRDEDAMDVEETRVRCLRTAAAKFLLALKEQHRLTQVSINFLVDQVKLIVAGVVADIKETVHSKLTENGVTTTLYECFQEVNPFEGLDTEYKQTKFYKEHFNLVVSLQLCMHVSCMYILYSMMHACMYICIQCHIIYNYNILGHDIATLI